MLVPAALRRLHDIGVSNRWAALLALSGPIGWLALLWLITLPGDSGPNPYGPPNPQVSRTTSLCTITSACG
ncbi:DUF805 domain-containing protein [Neogemmobacter tilapiae]|uniref:DUF805 domain-containing protein n=1 Tax=Neogemmobacter tilapiae TaxID=875041 RepID=UPI0035716734